jgi:hypothetical protein
MTARKFTKLEKDEIIEYLRSIPDHISGFWSLPKYLNRGRYAKFCEFLGVYGFPTPNGKIKKKTPELTLGSTGFRILTDDKDIMVVYFQSHAAVTVDKR